jgi:hypothetical protein
LLLDPIAAVYASLIFAFFLPPVNAELIVLVCGTLSFSCFGRGNWLADARMAAASSASSSLSSYSYTIGCCMPMLIPAILGEGPPPPPPLFPLAIFFFMGTAICGGIDFASGTNAGAAFFFPLDMIFMLSY